MGKKVRVANYQAPMIEHGDFRVILEVDGTLTILCTHMQESGGHVATGFSNAMKIGSVQADAFEITRVVIQPHVALAKGAGDGSKM